MKEMGSGLGTHREGDRGGGTPQTDRNGEPGGGKEAAGPKEVSWPCRPSSKAQGVCMTC